MALLGIIINPFSPHPHSAERRLFSAPLFPPFCYLRFIEPRISPPDIACYSCFLETVILLFSFLR